MAPPPDAFEELPQKRSLAEPWACNDREPGPLNRQELAESCEFQLAVNKDRWSCWPLCLQIQVIGAQDPAQLTFEIGANAVSEVVDAFERRDCDLPAYENSGMR